MSRALWKKCISESAILFLACAAGVLGFSWFRVHVVGELDTTTFQKILNLLPKDWLNFTTVDVDWLISYVGRTAMTLDEPFLVMMVAIWAIVRGSDVVSGEISRGTMEMLLAQPVSRQKVYWIHTAVTLIGVVLLVGVAWFGMWLGVQMTDVKVVNLSFFGQEQTELKPMSEFVDAIVFAPGLFNLLLLGFFIAGIATLFSAFDRYRWRTLGIVVSIYMVAAMIKILGMSSETFRWTGWFTFFSLYEPESDVKLVQISSSAFWQFASFEEGGGWKSLGPLGHNLILFVSGCFFFLLGLTIFKRRDISAPF